MSTITARYTDTQGNPAQGTVYISPAARAGVDNPPAIVTEKRVWSDLDPQGSVSLDVIPSDDPGWLIDGHMPYLVEERLMGLPFRSYWIGVPAEGVDLADVQQAQPDVAPMPVPGPTGPQGDTGPTGPTGPQGPAGVVNQTALALPPSALHHVPRLARTPRPETGDVGLPGYAGSDTGWRDVSSLLSNGWAMTSFRIRRAGSMCFLQMAGVNATSATANDVATIPAGFTCSIGNHIGVLGSSSSAPNATFRSSVVLTGVGNLLRILSSMAGVGNGGLFAFPTDDPWPTSLPGTQVSPPATWT